MLSRVLPTAAAATIALLAATGAAAHAAPAFTPGAPGAGDPALPTYGNGGFDVAHYDLDVRYQPAIDELTAAHATIRATATQNLSRFDLDLIGLTVDAVRVDGRPATWTRDGWELVVTPPRGLRQGRPFTVDVTYHGVPKGWSIPDDSGERPPTQFGFVPTDDGAIVLGEPESAMTWYPSSDHPADKATFAVAVTVPDGLAAISVGLPLGHTTRSGWTTWRWASRHPSVTYATTIAIGRWRIDSHLHHGRPTIIAVDAALGPQYDAPVARTDEIIDYFETLFGPYPFESAGAIVERQPGLLAALETRTRPIYPSDRFEDTNAKYAVETVAHETAHQWFGDSVSIDFWYDLWLNEGFATYASWLWDEHDGFRTVREQFNRFYDYPLDFPFWTPAPYDPTDGDAIKSSNYYRGAMALHALRKQVGDPVFFALLRTWAAQHRDGNASTEQFIALATRLSGQDVRPLLLAWLSGPVKPVNPDPPPTA
ncbi:M1 family metallopeptidase [Dactylosporangium matsuzakiense]|uniref:Aminopeptidase N n=1 Tax=Dactylosporangium matsuzakiense TaxID=53360 RepID=A0A9W6KE41_9ACTN|nr:M1 family metallopeptidase [Dactylosporangium matsuzakiense]GLK99827.1 peptidase [Dactylosporangium matsuzakiense]